MTGKSVLLALKIPVEFLIALIFPKTCLGCQKEGFSLCPDCLKGKIKIEKTTFCIYCGKISPKGICQSCRHKTALSGIIVASRHSGLIKQAIHQFKYQGDRSLAEPLCLILRQKLLLAGKNFNQNNTIITAVPLHKRRQNVRGFNQAELLAKELARATNIRYRRLLKRIRFSHPQTTLSRRARKQNLDGVFEAVRENLRGETIIVVDDVSTTGTTLNECAKILRKSGAKQVWGLVVAHGR